MTTLSLLRILSYVFETKHLNSIMIIDLHITKKIINYKNDDNSFFQNVYKLNLKFENVYKDINEIKKYSWLKWQNLINIFNFWCIKKSEKKSF